MENGSRLNAIGIRFKIKNDTRNATIFAISVF